MSHSGNDQIIDAIRDEMEEEPVVKIASHPYRFSTFEEDYKRGYLKGQLKNRIKSYGGHQYQRGQLNMINGKSDIFSKMWQKRKEQTKEDLDEIFEIIKKL